MSFTAINWAYEQPLPVSGQKFVLVTLANYCDEDDYCYVRQTTLAAMTSQGLSTVRRHLDDLQRAGLVVAEARYRKNGSQASNGYRLLRDAARQREARARFQGEQGGGAQIEQGGVLKSSTLEPCSIEPKEGFTNVNPSCASAPAQEKDEPPAQGKRTSMREAVSEFRAKQRAEKRERGQKAAAHNPWLLFCSRCVEAWNRRRPEAWAPLDKISPRDRKVLGPFWEHFDKDLEHASQMFEWAVAYVARYENWWKKGDFGIMTLGKIGGGDKLIDYALAAQHKAAQNRARGLAPGGQAAVPELAPGEVRGYQQSFNVAVVEIDGQRVRPVLVRPTPAHQELAELASFGPEQWVYARDLGEPL